MKRNLKLALAALTAFSLVSLASCSSNVPYVGDNGNWWVNGSDLGIPATGPEGPQGSDGAQGSEGPQGPEGPKGDDGEGVSVVSVTKTGSDGKVDTYTITFSDGSTSSFTVTNGEDGSSVTVTDVSVSSSDGVDTYTVTFSDGSHLVFTVKNGKDGENLSVVSIEKIGSDGLCDTYRITYSNGEHADFVVKNGATPYIGENGNWWIDGVDTGVLADASRADDRVLSFEERVMSTGLQYQAMTIEGESGYVVSGYDKTYVETYLGASATYEGYWRFKDECSYKDYLSLVAKIQDGSLDIVIPNYVGNIPVIGVSNVFKDSKIHSVSLSKHTRYLASEAFSGCSNLKRFDFNGSQIDRIPSYGFAGCGLAEIELPESVRALGAYSFSGCSSLDVDLSRIVFYGERAIDSLPCSSLFLNSEVEYVGKGALPEDSFIFIEEGANTEKWAALDTIRYGHSFDLDPITDCRWENDYIYKVVGNEVTLHEYTGTDRKLVLPSTIDGKPVTKIGSGFCTRNFEGVYYIAQANGGYYGNYLTAFDEIIIPNSVKEIEWGALWLYGTFIYIPKSVERMWEDVGGDEYASFLAFEGSIAELPSVFASTNSSSTDSGQTYYEEQTAQGKRIAVSVDYESLHRDEANKSYYVDEGASCSLLAVMDLDIVNLSIPSVMNEKPVTNIKSFAISHLTNLKFVSLPSSVTKISKYAFRDLTLTAVLIPSSVAIVNANGFSCTCSSFMLESVSVPEDWDSLWAGNQTTNQSIALSSPMDAQFDEYWEFDYFLAEGEITLLKYHGSGLEIYLPSVIDGHPVTSIESGFYSYTGSNNPKIFIPSSITKAKGNAFYSKSYLLLFYFEASSLPTGFFDGWTHTSDRKYYSQEIPSYSCFEDFLYSVNEDGKSVTLIQGKASKRILRIPRAIEGKAVTAIAGNFCCMTGAGYVVYIPKTVTSIGSSSAYAYTGSYSLTAYYEGNSSSLTTKKLSNYSSSKEYWNQTLDY